MTQSAVLVLHWGGQVLLLRRLAADRSGWGGYWCFPGGRCDEGETPRETAVREMGEETGIAIPNIMLAVLPTQVTGEDAKGRTYNVHAHEVRLIGLEPEVILSVEHDAYRWVDPNNLPSDMTIGRVTHRILRSLR